MNIKSLLAGALFALTLFATPAIVRADDPPVAVKADAKPVTIVRTYKVGDARRYTTLIKANVGGMEGVINGGQKMVVKEIKKDGSVVLTHEAEESKMEFGGDVRTQPATKPSSETRDKFGKLIDYTPSEDAMIVWTPEIQKLMGAISEVILNGKEVKAGESWETELVNPAVKDKTFKVKTTYVGTDKVEDVEYLKVEQNVSVEVDDTGTKMTLKTVHWLNPTDGSLFKSTATIKGLPSTFGPLDMEQTIKLAKPEEKKEKTDK